MLRFLLEIRMYLRVHTAASMTELYAKSAGKDALIHFRRSSIEIIRHDGTSLMLPSNCPRCEWMEALHINLARKRGPKTASACSRLYTTKKAYGDLYRQRQRERKVAA
jgi:hypothetical protein